MTEETYSFIRFVLPAVWPIPFLILYVVGVIVCGGIVKLWELLTKQ